ncbi:hypothetical protein Tco_0413293 [Tanacetum coccineum]
MKEAEPVQKKTKLQLEQERLGLEEALRLQEQLDEGERQMISRVHEEASTFNAEECDNIQAQIEADEELAHRLQAQERERYYEADKARLLNIGSHTLQQLKKLSFNEVNELFETTIKRVNTFTLMKSDDTVPKVVAGSSKIDAEQELNQERSNRQKIGEGSEPAEELKDELSQEQLQQLMIIVPEEGMNVEAYSKPIPPNPLRDDLVKLLSLVHGKDSNSTEPTEERDTLVGLKRDRGHDIFVLFEKDYPLTQEQIYDFDDEKKWGCGEGGEAYQDVEQKGVIGVKRGTSEMLSSKGLKVKEKLVHLMMVVKFEVLIEKKKMCSLGLMRGYSDDLLEDVWMTLGLTWMPQSVYTDFVDED